MVMIMNSLSFEIIDTENFEELYAYIDHIITTGHDLRELIVSPEYYKNILQHPLWYDIRLAKNAKDGFNYIGVRKMPNGNEVLKLTINSYMHGNFCII